MNMNANIRANRNHNIQTHSSSLLISQQIFMNDIPSIASTADIRSLCEKCGIVSNVEIDTNDLGRHFAFVTFENIQSVENALHMLPTAELKDTKVVVRRRQELEDIRQKRMIEAQCKLFVGNIPQHLSRDALLDCMLTVGGLPITDFRHKKGYCFVGYRTPEDAEIARRNLKNHMCHGKVLNAEFKKEEPIRNDPGFISVLEQAQRTLYVRDIPPHTDTHLFRAIFENIGKVRKFTLPFIHPSDYRDAQLIGYSFIEYFTKSDCDRALSLTVGTLVDGQEIEVRISDPPKDKESYNKNNRHSRNRGHKNNKYSSPSHSNRGRRNDSYRNNRKNQYQNKSSFNSQQFASHIKPEDRSYNGGRNRYRERRSNNRNYNRKNFRSRSRSHSRDHRLRHNRDNDRNRHRHEQYGIPSQPPMMQVYHNPNVQYQQPYMRPMNNYGHPQMQPMQPQMQPQPQYQSQFQPQYMPDARMPMPQPQPQHIQYQNTQLPPQPQYRTIPQQFPPLRIKEENNNTLAPFPQRSSSISGAVPVHMRPPIAQLIHTNVSTAPMVRQPLISNVVAVTPHNTAVNTVRSVRTDPNSSISTMPQLRYTNMNELTLRKNNEYEYANTNVRNSVSSRANPNLATNASNKRLMRVNTVGTSVTPVIVRGSEYRDNVAEVPYTYGNANVINTGAVAQNIAPHLRQRIDFSNSGSNAPLKYNYIQPNVNVIGHGRGRGLLTSNLNRQNIFR